MMLNTGPSARRGSSDLGYMTRRGSHDLAVLAANSDAAYMAAAAAAHPAVPMIVAPVASGGGDCQPSEMRRPSALGLLPPGADQRSVRHSGETLQAPPRAHELARARVSRQRARKRRARTDWPLARPCTGGPRDGGARDAARLCDPDGRAAALLGLLGAGLGQPADERARLDTANRRYRRQHDRLESARDVMTVSRSRGLRADGRTDAALQTDARYSNLRIDHREH